nr:hypothetical protein [uncultured Mucilaginibacter sp.]
MGFFIWLFCIRYCAYQGSKRLIGCTAAIVCGALFSVVGIWMVLSSRRLITEEEIKAIRLAAMEGGE